MQKNTTQPDGLDCLRQDLREFAAKRHWQSFHTPKNLASALAVEAAELLEPFQWLNQGWVEELGEVQLQAVKYEMADVLCYLTMLADSLQIDLLAAAKEKMVLNAIKYPEPKNA